MCVFDMTSADTNLCYNCCDSRCFTTVQQDCLICFKISVNTVTNRLYYSWILNLNVFTTSITIFLIICLQTLTTKPKLYKIITIKCDHSTVKHIQTELTCTMCLYSISNQLQSYILMQTQLRTHFTTIIY